MVTAPLSAWVQGFRRAANRLVRERRWCGRGRYGLLATGLTVVGLSVSATANAAATYQVPASIAGDCSVDVTQPVLAWIASVPDNSTLSFGANQCYRIEGTLEFAGRHGLDLEGNGSRFQSFSAPADQRALWRIDDSTGIVVHNMSLIGSYAQGGTFNGNLQHAHAIDLRGTNANISAVTMQDLAGDCVYFGLGLTSALTRSAGSVQNSTCTAVSRNAISVTAGDNILVQHLTTNAIGYDVFDVEPNVGAGFGSQSVTFDSNTIGSYAMSVYSIVENEPISNQAFTNNHVVGTGLKITVGKLSVRPSSVIISGNTADTAQAPSAMNIDSVDGLTVTGNTVPLTGGTMAAVTDSCQVNIANNTFPGASAESWITAPSCSAPPTSTTPPPTGHPAKKPPQHVANIASHHRQHRTHPPRAAAATTTTTELIIVTGAGRTPVTGTILTGVPSAARPPHRLRSGRFSAAGHNHAKLE